MVVSNSAQHRASVAVLAAALMVSSAQGADRTLGDGKLSVTGSTYLGTAIRTDDQDPKLLANVNSSQVGIRGNAVTPSAGRNQDDGNLNFNRGDPVSAVLKGYLSLEYKWRDYGIEASAKAWYDYATADADHPWGNVPNGLRGQSAAERRRRRGALEIQRRRAGQPLRPRPTPVRAGHRRLETRLAEARLGQSLHGARRPARPQSRSTFQPRRGPASLREQETRITFPAMFARLGLSKSTSRRGVLPVPLRAQRAERLRHLLLGARLHVRGLRQAMFGNLSDRTAIATGNYVQRTATRDPSNSGRAARAVTHGGRLGDQVRPLCHAVPFARAVYSGIKSGRAEGPLSCRATRATSIRRTSPSTPRTSGCSA